MAVIIKLCLCFLLIHQTFAIKLLQFPIGALFNRERLAITEDVFYKIVNTSGRAYTGKAFLPIADDTFSTSLELCETTSEIGGVAAIVDTRPTEGYCDMVCMLSNIINIPHLSLGWEIPETMTSDTYTFAYHPPLELISKAYAVLIKDLKWDKFTILYEDEGSFLRLHEVINTWPHSHEPILFRKLDPNGDNKEAFKHIFKVAHVSYHILDCKPQNVRKYINEIVQVENSTQYQGFILSDLDSYTVKLDDIPNWMANVSTMHLTKFNESTWTDMNIDESVTVKLETALMHDALSHLEKSLRAIIPEIRSEVYNDEILPSLCYKDEGVYPVLPYGERLRNALLNTTIPNGVTGEVIFDSDRKRTRIQLYYSKLNKDSQFVSAGVWDSVTQQITYLEDTEHITERGFEEKTVIKIVSREGRPYFHEEKVNDTSVVTGFAVDLIDAIFKYIKKEFKKDLKYEFYRVAGDKYGILSPETKKWNGLVGELIEHKADMAICDLTMTFERNSVVDFSTPFMSLGISILFRKPDPLPTDMFSFLLPLSLDVWLYLVTTYIIVSFILLICARMSQGDWVNPHPCNQNPENYENIWNLYNCMWLAMGTIMTQGCDILPQAPGSRWVTGMWWFFAMILTASYTANMSTFLSNSRRISDINDVKQLSEQSKVTYGAVYNASTYKFFEKSNETVYKKIWSVMSSAKPVVFTNNNEEGKDRVLQSKGKYAFFMESTGIEYFTAKYCDLKMVGSKLDSKEYGIAFPRNSPLKSWVDSAILHLQESLEIERIKNKWWKFDEQEGSCEERAQEVEEDDGSLQMKNTSGIFLVLGAGTFIGLIVAVIDFMMHSWKVCVEEKISFVEAMASEWRASLNPRTLQKPAAPPRSAAPTESPSPHRDRSQSRAVSVLRAATSFINFDEIY